ncbi:hypothetical protein J7J18_03575 [bacterium]|nr:hypothetical protein [bacterium]
MELKEAVEFMENAVAGITKENGDEVFNSKLWKAWNAIKNALTFGLFECEECGYTWTASQITPCPRCGSRHTSSVEDE